MNADLQAQFTRIELALNTLTTSISSYKPSVAAASDLLSADEGLSQSLDRLATHQSNHARISSLRAQSSALDDRITANLRTLADARAATVSASVHAPRKGGRRVPLDEVLNHTRATARFVAPNGFRAPQKPGVVIPTIMGEVEQIIGSPEAVDGAVSPSKGGETGGQRAEDDRNPGIKMLSDAERAWLDPATQTPFVPWPSEEMIARSALARNQGVDVGMIAKVQQEKAVNEQGLKNAVEEEQKQPLSAGLDVPAQAQARPREQKPAVFAGWDDDMDEDD